MSDELTTASEAPTATEVSAAKPRKAAKKAKKAAKAAKPSANGHEPKLLDAGQTRILKVLARLSSPVTANDINSKLEKAGDATARDWPQWIYKPLGPVSEESRKRQEKRTGRLTLLTQGFVRVKTLKIGPDEVEDRVYEITAAGRKALEKV